VERGEGERREEDLKETRPDVARRPRKEEGEKEEDEEEKDAVE